MDWNENIDLSKRKFTSRLIVERAIARGWRIAGFRTNPAIFLIEVPGREKRVKIFSASPPSMPYPASKIAKDKFITNRILAEIGVPVPKEYLLTGDAEELAEAERFLSELGRVVVKPLDASHGKGIRVNVSDAETLRVAINEARQEGTSDDVLLQEQLEGVDIRIVCIDYKFVDSISRIPARVKGDGTHTIRELVELTNRHEDRGENYATRLNVIPIDKVQMYLGGERMSEIPPADEYVQVIGVSNVGQGGERYNIKHDIPEFMKEIAEQCARELELPVCGVDFMVKRLPKVDDTQEALDPRIIEVNECPMLTMYDDLHSPEQDAVIDTYLDFVAR